MIQRLGIIVLLVYFFSIALPPLSFSADWKLITVRQGPKHDYYVYIDFKGAKRIGTKVRYWEAGLSNSQGSPPSNDEVASRGHKQYYEIDCSRKRYRNITTEEEEKSGYVQVYPGITWFNISPDSHEDKIADLLCKRRTK
jgi:hypothetical protein